MEFKKYLQKVREHGGYTVRTLSEKINVVTVTYRGLESGKSLPSPSSLYRLESVLELPAGTLSKRIGVAEKELKPVYIIHPLRSSVSEEKLKSTTQINLDHARKICIEIAANHPEILILSPLHAFSFMDYHGDQSRVMELCNALLDIAEEAWVFGDYKNSEGCKHEIERARELKLPIIYKEDSDHA